jgi:hypothetical protein
MTSPQPPTQRRTMRFAIAQEAKAALGQDST